MQPVCFFFLSAVNMKDNQVFWPSAAGVSWDAPCKDTTENMSDSLYWETAKAQIQGYNPNILYLLVQTDHQKLITKP